jgi:hypothetical protein
MKERIVNERIDKNHKRAVQTAAEKKVRRLRHSRLARECAKLDRQFEKAMAETGPFAELAEWPEY